MQLKQYQEKVCGYGVGGGGGGVGVWAGWVFGAAVVALVRAVAAGGGGGGVLLLVGVCGACSRTFCWY